MRRVYKYVLWSEEKGIEDWVILNLPKGAEVLTAQVQKGQGLVLWALVDPDLPTEERLFRVAGTGHPMPEKHVRHINSVQMFDGQLVFHVFEVLDRLEQSA